MLRRPDSPTAARPLRRTAAAVAVLAGVLSPAAVALAPAAGAATAACALPSDSVPPQLHDLTLSPTSVDVSHAGRPITVTTEATDTSGNGVASGVDGVLVVLTGPDGGQAYGSAAELRRVSGSSADGLWKGQLHLPRYAPAGSYQVSLAAAFDVVGNLQAYSTTSGGFLAGGPGFTISGSAQAMLARVEMQRKAQLAAAPSAARPAGSPADPRLQPGWTTAVQVASAPRPPVPGAGGSGSDTVHKGVLKSFTVHPQTVNTRHRARRVHVRARLAGGHPRLMEALFDDPIEGPAPQFAVDLHRGGRTYSGSVRVPTWAGRESFHITLYAVYVTRQGHQRLQAWTPDQLAAGGFSHVLRVDSGVDVTRPVLTSLAVSPDPVDSSAQSVHGTVSATATDNRSGVRQILVGFFADVPVAPGVRFTEQVKSLRLRRQGDHWSSGFQVGRCALAGTWQISTVVVDNAGNYQQYGRARLAALGLPSTLRVTSGAGDRIPPTVAGISQVGQDVYVQFSEPVVGLSTENLSLYRMRPSAHRYEQSAPVDAVTCYDASGAAEPDCSGSPAPVSSAKLTVSALVPHNRYQLWANQFSVTPQLTDLAGNPMDWLGAAGAFSTS